MVISLYYLALEILYHFQSDQQGYRHKVAKQQQPITKPNPELSELILSIVYIQITNTILFCLIISDNNITNGSHHTEHHL